MVVAIAMSVVFYVSTQPFESISGFPFVVTEINYGFWDKMCRISIGFIMLLSLPFNSDLRHPHQMKDQTVKPKLCVK